MSAYLASEEIKWKFSSPSSPNFCGLYEVGVKSFKYYPRREMKHSKVSIEQILTIISQIEVRIIKNCTSVPSAPLTYLELFSRTKSSNKTIWFIPPVHHWYQGSRPGCLSIDCSRCDQTTLTHFLSGHIRSLTFSDNSKCFEICPKRTAEQATPDHILACLGLSEQDLVSNPLLTMDFFRVHRLMDLI
ncbi:hypothetical protein AVEN_145903-1 [Araneus ventricosus]|uniref:Uncharacterized protein n=1 Tax=Araneus ventricosus TaxID=182803 RepID=A0A4Y2UR42_ARAVE|nr:hypothetical protein AVEN_145903-1 [Araneus ventricosus]